MKNRCYSQESKFVLSIFAAEPPPGNGPYIDHLSGVQPLLREICQDKIERETSLCKIKEGEKTGRRK